MPPVIEIEAPARTPAVTLEPSARPIPARPEHDGGGQPPAAAEGGDDHREPAPRTPRGVLAIRLAMAAMASLFAAFTLAYVILRWLDGRWRAAPLPSLLFWDTLALAASSAALHLGMRRQDSAYGSPARLRWGLTAASLLGLLFLAGQAAVWLEWRGSGLYRAANPSSAFLYLLTLAHGLHLAAGLGLLIAATVLAWRGRLRRRAALLECAAPLWHFLDGLWIYLYLLLRLAR